MSLEIVTPVGRFVQGSMSLEVKNDPATGKPKLNDKGEQVHECFIALAIPKNNPDLPAFWQAITQEVRTSMPHCFDAAGNCTHPQFAWKIQDGDGVDQSGKSVADKAGFAGHYIFKLATQYMPKCYHAGKYDAIQQIQNPEEVIKRGYHIRCNLIVQGNGVGVGGVASGNKKPGIFLSPNLVSLEKYGEVIQGGPDAAKVFGAAPTPSMPAGASDTPVGAVGGLTPPALPGMAAAMPGMGMPLAAPALPVPGAGLGPPPQAAGPVYQMTATAQGATREALIAIGWDDAKLIAAGHMVRTA